MIEIRQISGEEVDRQFELLTHAFRRGERNRAWFDNPNTGPYQSFGVFDEGRMQASLVILGFECHFGPEVVLQMGGVAGVCCAPEARGRGYASAGMRRLIAQMRENGQAISMLFPFSWSFYREFGYEWVGTTRRYTVPTRVLRAAPETARVRSATPEDRSSIIDAYSRFAAGYRGMLRRHSSAWDDILNASETHFTQTFVVPSREGLDGYLTFRGGEWKKTQLREFIALTPEAYRALLGLLKRHEMQTKRFAWSAPLDDGLLFHVCHWDTETTLSPTAMGRVVDVQIALSTWRPSVEVHGEFVLHVADPAAPWNDGTWHIGFEQGHVEVRQSAAAPDVTLDIRALSQCYFGTPTVAEVRRAGRLTVEDEHGYAAMQSFFAGPPMFLNDSF